MHRGEDPAMERVRKFFGTFISLVGGCRVVLEELLPKELSRRETRTTGEIPGNIL